MSNNNTSNIFYFLNFSFWYNKTNPVFLPIIEKLALKTGSRKNQLEKLEAAKAV